MIDYKKDNRITITKGDTIAWNIKFNNITEDLRSAYFTVKENPSDEALIQKSLGAGISKIDDRSYKDEKTYKLQIQAEDTLALSSEMQYLYDLKVAVGNVVKTILSGVFIAKESVTGASQIIIEDAEIEATDLIEAEMETTPATAGIEYEQDPVANAKIGDMDDLETTAKQTLVDAINEVKTQATASAEEIAKIEDGTVIVPEATNAVNAQEATHATSADSATNATNASTAGKVANALTFGSKTFDGSQAKTITNLDIMPNTWKSSQSYTASQGLIAIRIPTGSSGNSYKSLGVHYYKASPTPCTICLPSIRNVIDPNQTEEIYGFVNGDLRKFSGSSSTSVVYEFMQITIDS